jgi:hypothetical protein
MRTAASARGSSGFAAGALRPQPPVRLHANPISSQQQQQQDDNNGRCDNIITVELSDRAAARQ